MPEIDWIAVDWGTTNVRAWGIRADGTTGFERTLPKGMARLTLPEYPAVLSELMGGDRAPGAVWICGMAGARQGWREAPYLETPARLDRLAERAVTPEGTASIVRILPGIAQRQPGREDVMRGEETQLLGLLRLRPGFAGTAIMPGTHSKWIQIADGRIEHFETAMTGEIFDVLGAHSVLRHSLGGEQVGPATEDGVSAGLDEGLDAPERITSSLFRTRAAALLAGRGPDWCAGYLSGLLVGAEVGGHRDWLSPDDVPLVGSERLQRLYGAALARLGIGAEPIDARKATLAGLAAAREQVR